MTKLTPQQIAGVAASAGFTGQGLTWAVAVALAESGGESGAQHTNTNGSVDRGLWQINSKAHPEVSSAQAFDPASAARAAYTISKGGTSWTPWTTAKTGAAQAMLGTAALAASKPTAQNAGFDAGGILPGIKLGLGLGADSLPGGSALSDVGGTLDGLATVGKASASLAGDVTAAADWLGNKHNWSRIAVVLIGGAGALAGLVLLGQTGLEGPVGGVAKVAAKGASKAGATAKGAAKTVAKTAAVAAAA